MSGVSQSSTVLLNRLFTLKESSPLLLVTDTIAQSSYYLIKEFIHNVPKDTNIVYISFETIHKPKYANVFIEAYEMSSKALIEQINSTYESNVKNLIIIDSINFINNEILSQFLTSIIKPNLTVLATYHTSLPELETSVKYPNYPSSYKILSFIASSIFEIIPNSKEFDEEELELNLNKLNIVKGLNNSIFQINLINRRKSGRSINYKFEINTMNHNYNLILPDQSLDSGNSMDTQDLLKGLTTFNLTTSDKQKLAKDQVELPFLDAQSFNNGGAIVYEFEKDDDYDEEDPYEDPF
ncbi:Elongator complex protein [Wickerhamomyces ciferrii]|uniref:Elongator complex protein 5 n=1 Tax=Wickerhamomyces ciferrii (strain ATCC 14091 / BCRC 22168 / CBS 111 / JCM 3599 / NBRC 0793 / NRRL Y-1031 F-60-10) TaxID=1206466 RepID=K0KXP4_WICCF|nr:Elongator complex protein [Wickerhamomyces ciferrii]CCH45828.1 Elongator complex protein [Wickerhamomyces ciferrii]